MASIWDIGAVRARRRWRKAFRPMFGLELPSENGGRLEPWNGTQALANCARIDSESVANCSEKFSEEIKVHLA